MFLLEIRLYYPIDFSNLLVSNESKDGFVKLGRTFFCYRVSRLLLGKLLSSQWTVERWLRTAGRCPGLPSRLTAQKYQSTVNVQASDSPVVPPAAEQCHYRPLEVPVPALSGDRVLNFNCVVVEESKQAGLGWTHV